MEEIWKPLPNIDYFSPIRINRYLISNTGKVLNAETGKELKSFTRYNKWKVMSLSRVDSYEHRVYGVAWLVMLAFDYRPDFKDLWIYHMDGNTLNNNLDNLMWSDRTKFGKKMMMIPSLDKENMFIDNTDFSEYEVWQPLPHTKEFENINVEWYLISSYGRVYSRYLNREAMSSIGNDNYRKIDLSGDNYYHRPYRINRLVALAFKYKENSELYQVNHIDGNPLNNFVGNLEWVLPVENTHHAFMTGLSSSKLGETNNTSKVSNNTVLIILNSYIEGLSIDTISNITGLTVNYINDIINAKNRFIEIIDFVASKSNSDIKNIFTEEELNFIIDNSCYDIKEFKNKIRSINIQDNTIKFLASMVVRKFVINKNQWYSKMYFYNKSYYLEN